MSEKFDYDSAEGSPITRELYDWVESAMLAVSCMLLIFMFVGRMIGVEGRSMVPTLYHADRLVSSRIAYTPTQGDVVVVTLPGVHRAPMVKRIIAIGGQVIDINELGIVYVDGAALEEPYISGPDFGNSDMWFPQTVPEGYVFILGDNRVNSLDSRSSQIGMVDERFILGRVLYRILPYDEMGRIN